MSPRRAVAVRILGHEYRIRTDADEAVVERVAALVDETMTRIRDRTGTVDTLDLAILTALNLANDVIALRGLGGADASRIDPRRLHALIDATEAALVEDAEIAS